MDRKQNFPRGELGIDEMAWSHFGADWNIYYAAVMPTDFQIVMGVMKMVILQHYHLNLCETYEFTMVGWSLYLNIHTPSKNKCWAARLRLE